MSHPIEDPKSTISSGEENKKETQEGWHELSHSLPSPTYWPAALALGTALTFLGITTSYIVSIVGLILLGISIAGWVRELRNATNE